MKSNLQKIVAINLKFLRYKAGKSQEEFYGKSKLNVKYMACIERGSVNFKASYLNKISESLNINLEELLTIDETRTISKKRIDQKMSN